MNKITRNSRGPPELLVLLIVERVPEPYADARMILGETLLHVTVDDKLSVLPESVNEQSAQMRMILV